MCLALSTDSITRTPFASNADFFSFMADLPATKIVSESEFSRNTLASGELERFVSRMTRMASFPLPWLSRVVKLGSSACTVLIPTKMASTACRSWWTTPRDCSLVTHLESPVRVAIRPSRVAAHFRMTKGRLVRMYFINISFSLLAFSSQILK